MASTLPGEAQATVFRRWCLTECTFLLSLCALWQGSAVPIQRGHPLPRQSGQRQMGSVSAVVLGYAPQPGSLLYPGRASQQALYHAACQESARPASPALAGGTTGRNSIALPCRGSWREWAGMAENRYAVRRPTAAPSPAMLLHAVVAHAAPRCNDQLAWRAWTSVAIVLSSSSSW